MELSSSVKATGASYEDLTLVLRVKVKEYFSCEESRLKRHSTVKSCLLCCCEEALDLSAWNVGNEHRHLSSHTDSAVCTESRVRSNHPAILNDIFDGILCKIMLNSLILLTYHVSVALENDYRDILISRSCFLYDQHVTGLVGLAFKIVFSCKLLQVSDDVLFVTRLSWNLGYLLEVGKDFF